MRSVRGHAEGAGGGDAPVRPVLSAFRAPRYHALKRVAPSDWEGFLRTWIEDYDELDTLATLLAAR